MIGRGSMKTNIDVKVIMEQLGIKGDVRAIIKGQTVKSKNHT